MSNDKQLEHHQHCGAQNKLPLRLVLHNIELAENVGSLFRIADALGIEKLYLCENSCSPPNRKLRKSARSCDRYVDYEIRDNSVALINELREQGFNIIALEITENSTALAELKRNTPGPCALILGNENTGVSEELLSLCDLAVHIPMLGNNSSMNVANACAIACYELGRQLKQYI